jgi:type I restriction enzyme M protein
MDLRQWTDNPVKREQKKKVELKADQIKRASEIYFKWQSEGTDGTNYAEPELYRSVGIEEIDNNGYSLVPSRYIEFVDRDTTIDYHQVLTETATTVSYLLNRQKRNDETLRNALNKLGYECK